MTARRFCCSSWRGERCHFNTPSSRLGSFSERSEGGGRWVLAVLVALLVPVGLALVFTKHRSLIGAADRVEGIQWERDDWTVPQLELSSFRKNGKIARLNEIEAGFVCEVPVKVLA